MGFRRHRLASMRLAVRSLRHEAYTNVGYDRRRSGFATGSSVTTAIMQAKTIAVKLLDT